MGHAWFDELAELIAIPSVSADPERASDVRRAAEWVRDFIRATGGEAELVETQRQPLVIGEVRASANADSAPTVLCYCHFDVQPPAPLERWTSDPFTLVERDGWLYARGVTDDKGQLYIVLAAVRGLAAEGKLPVNVRIAFDGEEEVGGTSIGEWVAADTGPADACLILDGGMTERDKPEFTIATRGLVAFDLTVRTGPSDLHSGLFGNAGLNAIHALMQCLQAILPRGGRLPEPLRAGILSPSAEELAGWSGLKPGAELLAQAGIAPYDERAAEDFYVRTWAEPSAEINGFHAGKPILNTTLISSAHANFTLRLAPGQDPVEIAGAVRSLVEQAAPSGAELELEQVQAARPGIVDPDALAIKLGLDGFERGMGVRPLLVRVGGTMPVLARLVDRGVPTIMTGFGLIESNVHAPDERLPVEYVETGIRTIRELFVSLGSLSKCPRPVARPGRRWQDGEGGCQQRQVARRAAPPPEDDRPDALMVRVLGNEPGMAELAHLVDDRK
jgi:acetylornithine deacetylase/succinyl-diaminopimelate desuccinylase-like protein